jgi:hypothetical protein
MKKIFFLLLAFIFLPVSAGAWTLSGVSLTESGIISWDNTNITGNCLPNFETASRGAGGSFWWNNNCNFADSVDLKDSNFSGTDNISFPQPFCFQINNNGGNPPLGYSDCVNVYLSPTGLWNFYPQPVCADHSTISDCEADTNCWWDILLIPNGCFEKPLVPPVFPDWATWYAGNSSGGYGTPSAFATSFVGFFTPIFTAMSDTMTNAISITDLVGAYDKGFELSNIFPTAQAYLDKINFFFGGFPLVQFFEFTISLYFGIFLIRAIFKFIPFFG